jgi:uncharacterized protein YbjQ (UPF0145 family)
MKIISTTHNLDGIKIKEYLGIAKGLVVRSPTISQSFFASIKSMVGGKMGALTNMCEKAREEAFNNMIKEAKNMGANAVIGVDYDSSDISFKNESATEIICYGTAVIVDL